jgi:IS30 family transposase
MPTQKKSLSIKKLEIIWANEAGEKKRAIAKRIGRHQKVVQRVLKAKQKILDAIEAGKNPKLKRLKRPRYADVDSSVLGWLKYIRSENLPVTGDLLKVFFQYAYGSYP